MFVDIGGSVDSFGEQARLPHVALTCCSGRIMVEHVVSNIVVASCYTPSLEYRHDFFFRFIASRLELTSPYMLWNSVTEKSRPLQSGENCKQSLFL